MQVKCKVQIGNGMITPTQRGHLEKKSAQQWQDEPLAAFAKQVKGAGVSTTAIDPAFVHRFSTTNSPSIQGKAIASVVFSSGVIEIGGGWITPLLRKHLRASLV